MAHLHFIIWFNSFPKVTFNYPRLLILFSSFVIYVLEHRTQPKLVTIVTAIELLSQ